MKFTAVVTTNELVTNGGVSQQHTYYIQVEAEDSAEARKAAEERYRVYWAATNNQHVTRENWASPSAAPKPKVTSLLNGWTTPADAEGAKVIEKSWRRPYNKGIAPDARA
jgi:hypothetical protein